MLRRALLVVITMAGLSLVGVAPARAAITASTLVGTTATVTADGVGPFDQFDIGRSGGNLTLNASDDWDSATPGIQTLADGATSTVIINAGDGIDIISLGTSGDTFASSFTINGEGGADFLFAYPGAGSADAVTINGNSLVGPNLAHLAWNATLDQVNIRTGNGNDTVNVTATPTSPQALVYAEGGDDTLKLANGFGLGAGGVFRGGPGTDTVDYSAYSTPVSADLGKTAKFKTNLTAAAVVPPSGSAATGSGFVEFTDLATSTFDYELDASGLTSAQITDAHLHQGAVGVNGPTILPIGAGATWVDPSGPETEGNGLTDPDVTEPALRTGNTYFEIQAAGGDIRGQLTLDPDDGYGGTATGVSRVFTVENLVGGSGNDTFTGSVPANHVDCGPGQDTVTPGPGDTLTNCDKGGTGTVSALKAKAKAKGKKVTIDTGATAACPATAAAACTVTASASAKAGKKSVALGQLGAAVTAGQSLRVVLKVPKKGIKAWRKAGKLKITVTITITVPDGTTATATATKKLKVPPSK